MDALGLYTGAEGVESEGLGLNVFVKNSSICEVLFCFCFFGQEALQRSRPDFISRSQGRVQELERRAQERRELAQSIAALRQRRAHSARSTSLNGTVPAPTEACVAAMVISHMISHTHTDAWG